MVASAARAIATAMFAYTVRAGGKELELTIEDGFGSDRDMKTITMSNEADAKLRPFVGSDEFVIVGDRGAEWHGCKATARYAGSYTFQDFVESPFGLALRAADSAYQESRQPENLNDKGAQAVLDAIEKMRPLATTEGQRMKVAEADGQWGRTVRTDIEVRQSGKRFNSN